jgi:hypothetical protein
MVECQCESFTMSPSVSSDFNVPMPEWDNLKGGFGKDLAVLNMWTGDLEVFDMGLNSQNLIIGGTWVICGEWEGACFPMCFPICFSEQFSEAIENIHSIMNDGEEITIETLDTCFPMCFPMCFGEEPSCVVPNGVYVIRNFGLDTIERAPSAFKYIFELEKVRDL